MNVKNCSCGNCASVCWGQDGHEQKIKWRVRCADCGAYTDFYKTKTEAIKAWEKGDVHYDK